MLDKETRKQQLLEASIKVFARSGYRATSIDEIIKEAGVARGTFYLYFEGKKEIFHSIIDHYFEKLQELFQEFSKLESTPQNFRRHVRKTLLSWLGFFAQNRDLAKIMFREANAIDESFERRWLELGDAVRAELSESIKALQKAGCFRKNISPEAVCIFISGMFHESVCEYILRTEKPDLNWLVDQWIEFELYGLVAPECT
jgi:AcrR family transcriptional regulator